MGELLHGVINEDQSSRVLDRHLLRDLRGNIRAFGQQKVRCVKCNHSYRRTAFDKEVSVKLSNRTLSVLSSMQSHEPPSPCFYLPNDKSDNCEKCDFTLMVDVKCSGKIIQTVYASKCYEDTEI